MKAAYTQSTRHTELTVKDNRSSAAFGSGRSPKPIALSLRDPEESLGIPLPKVRIPCSLDRGKQPRASDVRNRSCLAHLDLCKDAGFTFAGPMKRNLMRGDYISDDLDPKLVAVNPRSANATKPQRSSNYMASLSLRNIFRGR